MRVVLVTNMPAPYRINTLNAVAQEWGDNLLVIFCARREPNRKWDFADMNFRHLYLKENIRTKKDGVTFIHNNTDIWGHLKSFNPDVIITGGFNPTMLYAFFFCLWKGRKHISLSDSWELLEEKLSFIHKLIRRLVYRFSKAFIACSIKGKAYFNNYYKIKPEAVFISPLTIDINRFANNTGYEDRPFDLLFSGRFVASKNPVFFAEVAATIKQSLGRSPKVLVLGEGPLEKELFTCLEKAGIDFEYAGFIGQDALPAYYSKAKLFLFPTAFDAWGVVANEALASGTPVIITPYAGCSEELVIHNENGFVLPLETVAWATQCITLIQDKIMWARFSKKAKEIAAGFTHDKAAKALMAACNYATSR